MMQAMHTIDLNPPLNYFLTRWSIAAFGPTPWATRLPEIVAFWVGGLAIFELLRRRASVLIGALGVLLLWCCPFFSYAAEARPYGLLLGFTALLVAAWDAVASGHRRFGIPLLAIAGVLLLLSHIFGLLSLGAVWVGEGVRSWRRRKIDWPMIAMLLLPLLAAISYRPMFLSYHVAVFPAEANASWSKLGFLYYAIFRWMWRPLLAIGLVAILFRDKHETNPTENGESASIPGTAWVLALLFLIPVGLTILFMRSHGAFYDRYGMATAIPIVLLAPILLRRWTAASASASFAALCAVGFLLLLSTTLRPPLVRAAERVLSPRAATKVTGMLTTSMHGPFRPWWKKLPVPQQLLSEREQAPLLRSLDDFYASLPLVAASEITFVEMDNRESADVTRRLFYLYDRKAEIEIAHRTIADGMLEIRDFYPLRGTLAPYQQFVAENRQFLVIGLFEHPGDWLLRKAESDGASLQVVARYNGYSDTDIYLVTFPAIRE